MRPARPSRAALAAAALAALLAGTATSGCARSSALAGNAGPDSTLIRRDIAWLADDAREGRGTGTPGLDSAAQYVARRFAALGLAPLAAADSVCNSPCSPGYLQRYTARPVSPRGHAGPAVTLPASNVMSVLRGSDPALRDEYVIVGAHMDHLGRSSESALDPDAKDAIRNGADDNASGTAAVMELARLFARHPARRSIVFTTFSGEELGLLGSAYWADHPPVPLDKVMAMVNFDMVGRLKNDKLIVYGVATATELPAIVDSANAAPRLAISAQGDGFGPSDHSSFYAKNVPVLHFFSDLHDDYHRATDDVEKINAGGEARIVGVAERVIRTLADRDKRLTFVKAAAPVASGGSSRTGSNVYLGSIPDMASSAEPGLRLSGVRAGSPADKGGLKTGDLIVEFAGAKVTDIYSYTDALYSKKPGDTVTIVVMRDGKRVNCTVTLGERGK
ncbi:MAG: M28 family peptidase [Gemmatimonadetes bacterium]|nr:M28 family peptidase [Gemmatimonadota bacterium]